MNVDVQWFLSSLGLMGERVGSEKAHAQGKKMAEMLHRLETLGSSFANLPAEQINNCECSS